MVKFMKKDRKDIEGGRFMKGKDRRIGFGKRKEKNMEKSQGGDHE